MRYATKISKFFYNPKQLLLIPLYQRKYAWEEIHCKRLFDDIIKVANNDLQSHFFGSIVSIQDNMLEDDLLIIDGQQRITTISLIVLALKNAVKNGAIPCCYDEQQVNQRTELYLFASFRNISRTIKLNPIESDRLAYDALFSNNPKEFVENTGITNNYNFFYSQIVNSGLPFENIFDALEKLIIIDLRLEQSDNPQLIFESLNSTGKDLTEADKIRNYLLMALSKDQQENYYRQYWRKIEICTDEDPTMFIRDFLTIKLKRICNIDNLYFDFKEYDETFKPNREDLFRELRYFAEYYEQISKGKTGIENIDKKLKQLSSLRSLVAMPFYLSFFDFANHNSVPNNIIYNVLDITENYWARRIMCGYPANTLTKLYSTLHSDIYRIYSEHEKRGIPLSASQYDEIMKYVLLKKQGNAKFPSDLELDEGFKSRWVYKLPIEYRCFLFERMENGNGKEGFKPIVEEMQKGRITIEHIMPQTLTPQWIEALGDNYKEIHEKYLHTFANLTLTGYNSNYSNHSFTEKQNGYVDNKGNHIYGFKDSGYNLSNYLRTCSVWTEKEIVERGQQLLNHFKDLWGMISSTYQPLEKDTDIVSFADDEYELTGRKILAFSFRGQKHEVPTWKEMLLQICNLVYKEYQSHVMFLSQKGYWFHLEGTSERSRIADNCYVYSSCSNKTKQAIISYLFKECGIADEDLMFYLQPISDKQVIDTENDS